MIGFTGHEVKSGFSAAVAFNGSSNWKVLLEGHLSEPQWKFSQYNVSIEQQQNRIAANETSSVRLSFVCVGSEAEGSNFCGVDSVQIRVI